MTLYPLHVVHRVFFSPIGGVAERRLRVGVGVLVIWWATSWLIDVETLLTDSRLLPSPSTGFGTWSLLTKRASAGATYTVLLLALTSGIGLVTGQFPRLAAVAAFVTVVSVHRTQPFGLNAGDSLLRLLLLWMAVGAVCGSERSLQNGGSGNRPAVVVRLVQIQVVVMYLTAALWKIQSARWRGGDAVYMVLTNNSVAQLPWPSFVSNTWAAVALLSWCTIALELSLAVGLTVKRTRRYAIYAAAIMHLVFAYSLSIGIFTPVALVALSAFTGEDGEL